MFGNENDEGLSILPHTTFEINEGKVVAKSKKAYKDLTQFIFSDVLLYNNTETEK